MLCVLCLCGFELYSRWVPLTRKRETAVLKAAFTKARFSQLPYKLCIFTFS